MVEKILKVAIIGGSIDSTIGNTHIKAINLNNNLPDSYISFKKLILNFLSKN